MGLRLALGGWSAGSGADRFECRRSRRGWLAVSRSRERSGWGGRLVGEAEWVQGDVFVYDLPLVGPAVAERGADSSGLAGIAGGSRGCVRLANSAVPRAGRSVRPAAYTRTGLTLLT